MVPSSGASPLEALEIRILPSRILDIGEGTPIDLNDGGKVLWTDTDGVAFVSDPALGTKAKLEVPAGFDSLTAVDINNLDVVTGYLGYDGPLGPATKGFVWEDGVFTLLPDSPDYNREGSEYVGQGAFGDVQPSSVPYKVLDNGTVVGHTMAFKARRYSYWTAGQVSLVQQDYVRDLDGSDVDGVWRNPLYFTDVAQPVVEFDVQGLVKGGIFATANGTLVAAGRAVETGRPREMVGGELPRDVPQIEWQTASRGRIKSEWIVGDVPSVLTRNTNVLRFADDSGAAILTGPPRLLDTPGRAASNVLVPNVLAGSAYFEIPDAMAPGAVNSELWVVGAKQSLGYAGILFGGATLWKPGQEVIDLEQELPQGQQWTLENAIRINNRRAVLGSGINEALPNGGSRVYVLELDDQPAPPLAVRNFTNARDTVDGSRSLRLEYTIPDGQTLNRFDLSFGSAIDSLTGAVSTLLSMEVNATVLNAAAGSRNGLPGIQLIDQNGVRLPAEQAFRPGTHTLLIDPGETIVQSAIQDRSVDSVLARLNGEWAVYEGMTTSLDDGTLVIRGSQNNRNSVVVTSQATSLLVQWTAGTARRTLTIPSDRVDSIQIFGGLNDDRLEVNGLKIPSILKGRDGTDTYAFSGRMTGAHVIQEDLAGDGPAIRNRIDFGAFAAPITLRLENLINSVNEGLDFSIAALPGTIKTVIGSRFDDTLAGDAHDNVLIGGDGSDTITGLAGNDILWGDSITLQTADRARWMDFLAALERGELRALGGNWNTIGTGQDVIDGGTGSDAILGGGGLDDLTGADGSDLIVSEGLIMPQKAGNTGFFLGAFLTLGNSELVAYALRQSEILHDWLRETGVTFPGVSLNTVRGGAGSDFIVGGDGPDGIDTGTGVFDTVYANGGNDIVNASAALGSLVFGGNGDDTIAGGGIFAILNGDSGQLGLDRLQFEVGDRVEPLESPFEDYVIPLNFKISFEPAPNSYAGHGSDTISSRAFFNVATGGAGAEDVFHLEDGFLNVAFGEGFSGQRYDLDFSGLLDAAAGVRLLAESGNLDHILEMTTTLDRLWSLVSKGIFNSTSKGLPNVGRDIIYGGTGWLNFDLLFGEDGDDRIEPSRGFQFISGGRGNDEILVTDRPDASLLQPVAGINAIFGDDGNDVIRIWESRWLANVVFGDGFQSFPQLHLGSALIEPGANNPNVTGLARFRPNVSITASANAVESSAPGNDTILLNWEDPAAIPGQNGPGGGSDFALVVGGSGNDTIRSAARTQIVIGDTLLPSAKLYTYTPDWAPEGTQTGGIGADPGEQQRLAAEKQGQQLLNKSQEIIKQLSVKISGSGDDSIRLTGGAPFLPLPELAFVAGGQGSDRISMEAPTGQDQSIPFLPSAIVAFGGDGNDDIDASPANFAFLAGEEGDDTLRGADQPFSASLLFGDTIKNSFKPVGTPLDRFVDFSLSVDTGTIDFNVGLTFSGRGNDTLIGRQGFNFLMGNDGDDTILGGSGANIVFGDSFNVGTGFTISLRDTLYVLYPPRGWTSTAYDEALRRALDVRVPLLAGSGRDRIALKGLINGAFGGSGDDTIVSTEKSLLNGVAGNAGNDVLEVSGLVNFAFGGLGNDRITSLPTDGPVVNLFVGDETGINSLVPRSVFATLEKYQAPSIQTLSANEWSSVTPLDGNDTLIGGNDGFDVLIGNGGNDTVRGLDGVNVMAADELWLAQAEMLLTNPGAILASANTTPVLEMFRTGTNGVLSRKQKNTVIGGNGTDLVFGGVGTDVISTFGGIDLIYGGLGDDEIRAGSGLDVVHGGAGNDTIYGGGGTNLLIGGAGNDTIFGGDDGNVVFGDELLSAFSFGEATMSWISSLSWPATTLELAGIGNDRLFGGTASDLLIGGLGNDAIDGGAGFNVLIGDEIRALQPTTLAVPLLFQMTALVPLSARLAAIEFMIHGPADLPGGVSDRDTLIGGAQGNLLFGGRGSDVLRGGIGSDVLYGGAGDDELDGGESADVMLGGLGRDRFRRDRRQVTRLLEERLPLTDFTNKQDLWI